MDKLQLILPTTFEDLEGDEEHHYVSLFYDHPEQRGGVMVAPYFLLKIQREEIPLFDVRFG